jgi:hypothetical protein
MSVKVKRAEQELAELNESFRNKKIFFDNDRTEVYSQLEKKYGIDISNSVLVSWLPEGDGYYSCCLIDQNKCISFIEINVDDSMLSTIETCTIGEYKSKKFFKSIKPWDTLKIAIDNVAG